MATMMKPLKTLPGVITASKWLPPEMCIYGDAGIGKSTFGAASPDPIFVTTEAGVDNLDVARFPVAESLDVFMTQLSMIAHEEHDYKSVVLDTLNGLTQLYLQARQNASGYDFVNFGGHSGWGAIANEIRSDLFPLLHRCKRRGMYVIILAHAGTYTDKTSIDDVVKTGASVNKMVWKAVLGEMDVVGKAEYIYSQKSKMVIRDRKTGSEQERVKASTDEEVVNGVRVKRRRIVFEGGMEVDAKTRIGYELPPEIPLSWDEFASRLGNIGKLVNEIRSLWDYLPADRVSSTLEWLGVSDLEYLTDANRSRLSQLRNRLLELKTESEARQTLPSEEPAASVS